MTTPTLQIIIQQGSDWQAKAGDKWIAYQEGTGYPDCKSGEGKTIADAIDNYLDLVDDGDVSNCCGAAPRGNGDNDSKDYGICPACGDYCEYVNPVENFAWK